MPSEPSDGIGRSDLDECWCCGGLHDSLGCLCPDCDEAGCQHFGEGCQSGHKPVIPDGDHSTSGTERTSTFSAFPYIGSKTYLAPWVVEHLRSHENFVVPFGGAAGVLLNKPRSGCEIYNDRDQALVEFFRACREYPEELAERVRNIPFSRSVYNEWSRQFRSGDGWPDDVVERAARWVYLRYASFSGRYGQRAGFATDTPRRGPQKSRIWQQMPERIIKVRDLFRGVAIENLDYSDILGRYKDAETLYYCDPPYTEAKDNYYRGPRFDHERFVSELETVDGHWMVSYRDPPDGLEDLATAVVERSYNRSAAKDNEDRPERLYLSYQPHEVPMFVDGTTVQQTLVAATDGGNDRAVDSQSERDGEPRPDGGLDDPATRLREARKQATIAREELDQDSQEWEYAQKTAANAESALVLLEGPEVLEKPEREP